MLTEKNKTRRGHGFYPPRAVPVPRLGADDENPVAWVHYFVGGADWYIVELDRETGEAYGWAEVVAGCGEFGAIWLPELESVLVGRPLRQPVERDLGWEPTPMDKVLTERTSPRFPFSVSTRRAHV